MRQRWLDFLLDPGAYPVPAEARAVAARQIADAMACAVAAVLQDDAGSRIVRDLAADDGGRETCHAVGMPRRLPTSRAAWVNAYLMHALDYDDYTLSSWIGHPTVVLAPALLAVAETRGRSGREVLDAYVVGHEIGARLGLAAGARQYALGWHNTATLGTVAAAAATVRLLGLSETEARHALSIAASSASGLKRNFGTMTKPLHAGQAARGAVEAVTLATMDLTAASDALAGSQGLLAALSGTAGHEADAIDAAWAREIADLGTRWDLLTPGIGTKPYPSCAYSHWVIDAALRARADGIRGERVARVEFHCDRVVSQVCIYASPATGMEGKFSLPYCFATTLRQGRVGLADFRPEPVADTGLSTLMARCDFVHDGRFQANPWGGEVQLRTIDGDMRVYRIDAPAGSPARPLSDVARFEKFSDCLSGWDVSRIDRQWRGWTGLETQDAAGIVELLEELAVC